MRRRGWLYDLPSVLLVISLLYTGYVSRNAHQELRECRAQHTAYVSHVNKRLCEIGRKLGHTLDGCIEG